MITAESIGDGADESCPFNYRCRRVVDFEGGEYGDGERRAVVGCDECMTKAVDLGVGGGDFTGEIRRLKQG